MPDDAYKSLISIKRPDECWGVWKDEVLSCVCPEQTLFCRCYCSGLASDLFGSGSGRSSSMRIRRAGLSVSSNCPESDMRKKIQTASAITPRLMMMRRGRTSMVFDCRLPHRPAGWIATLASRARNDGLLSSPRGAKRRGGPAFQSLSNRAEFNTTSIELPAIPIDASRGLIYPTAANGTATKL